MAVDEAIKSEIEQFLYREARLMDRGEWEAWLDLFAEGGMYWVPLAHDQPDPVNHASIYYENAMMREVRVRRLRETRAWSQQPPTRTVRIVGNVTIEDASADAAVALSSLHVMEFRPDERRLMGALCRHELTREGGDWRIALKRVDLADCDAPLLALELFL